MLFLLLLLVTRKLESVEVYKSVIAVYDTAENTNMECINGTEHRYHIQDLVHLDNLSDTQVRICSNVIILNETISLSQVSGVAIVGYDFPTIQCSNGTEAGFNFTGIQNLVLSSFTITNCALPTNVDPVVRNNIKASLNIQDCTNVSLAYVNVTKGPGTGISMFNNDGSVKIHNCTLQENGYDRKSGGNGIYMEIRANGTAENTHYTIQNCLFLKNVAWTGKDSIIEGFSRFDKGGGMCIYVLNGKNVVMNMINVTFRENQAEKYGGGMLITYHGDSKNNNITMINSTYVLNSGKYGGGLYLGYLHTRSPTLQTPINSSYNIISTTFMNNSAKFGGGISIFSTRTVIKDVGTQIVLENCTWMYNRGHFGSAISILPNAWNLYGDGYLPAPIFSNCTINSNYVMENKVSGNVHNFYQFTKGSGAFYCARHNVHLKETTRFENNNGTALYLLLCLATFVEAAQITFKENSGYYGGAIYQLSSIVYLSNNIKVRFIRNTAYNKGGAIYEETQLPHIREYSRTCFIDYVDDTKIAAKRNISVSFTSNKAGVGNHLTGYGHSIYGVSLQPCYNRFRGKFNRSGDIFNQIGKFTFFPTNRPLEIATDVNHSAILPNTVWPSLFPFIAGKENMLNFIDHDDLMQKTRTDYLLTIMNEGDSRIRTSQAYSHISNYTLALHGRSDDTSIISLTATASRGIAISFRARIQPCPPGFIQNREYGNIRCICSVDTVNEYPGISTCNSTTFQASRRRGYWVGYGRMESEDSLLSSYCPSGYCSYSDILLPSNASRIEISSTVCSESRLGKLCGKCKDNYSVYFNSLDLTCQKNQDKCNWGWLFYILSELMPVTIVFLTIIFFNIPFTAGIINGFIFYVQVVEWFHISGFQAIIFPSAAVTIREMNTFIYLMFSLHFFVQDKLSFCLWEGANALDIMAFSYTTLLYSFLLIVLVVIVLSKCNCRYSMCNRFVSLGFRMSSAKGGIIHGLTAFLILCYSQCARTSMLLLASAEIRSKGSSYVSTVVYFNGELEWFKHRHLLYALPALVFVVLIVLLPPTFLLVYPLHYKILSILKLEEAKFVQILLHPLEKMKPFLDSFQSCFKDEYRFFSGLYLFYRLAIQLNMGLNYLQESYVVLEIQLVVMFMLHAICQPYKKNLHNVIDSLLFGNLIIINALTMYNYSVINSGIYKPESFTVTTWIQVVLIILPLLLFTAAFILLKVSCKIYNMTLSKVTKRCSTLDHLAVDESIVTYDTFQYSSYRDER